MIKVHNAKIEEWARTYDGPLFDAVLCDPPYGLSFMGKSWDHGVPSAELWGEVYRILKPGAMLLAFGGTRTYHRLTCAIEDAGFEIRDCVMWLYGSGFPKSLDISKAIDKAAGAEREVIETRTSAFGTDTRTGDRVSRPDGGAGYFVGSDPKEVPLRGGAVTHYAKTWSGYGTALKPAWEPCIVAMKPCEGTFAENALKHGVAGLNIDAGRIETAETLSGSRNPSSNTGVIYGVDKGGEYSQNALGRWPANLILDAESGEMLDTQTGDLGKSQGGRAGHTAAYSGGYKREFYGDAKPGFGDSGGASRFFYCAKVSTRERNAGLDGFEGKRTSYMNTHGGNADKGETWHPIDDRTGEARDRFSAVHKNNHPTLKPIDLCRYLASLILPPKRDEPRRILVPFSGSGSEMIGASLAGWDEVIGVEKTPEYVPIAEARIAHWVVETPQEQPNLFQ